MELMTRTDPVGVFEVSKNSCNGCKIWWIVGSCLSDVNVIKSKYPPT